MGYMPAPARVSRLIVPGADPIPLGTNADVSLIAGAGMSLRGAGRGITLNAVLAQPSESLGLYVPAPAGGDTLGTWVSTFRSGSAYLRKLLVNLQAGGATATGTDYYRVKVTDAAGAVGVLPLPNNGRVFMLDQGIGSTIVRNRSEDNPATWGAPDGSAQLGNAHRFTTSQALTITGLKFAGLTGEVLPNDNTPFRVRASILDVNGATVGYGYCTMPAGDTKTTPKSFPFVDAATLLAGGIYWIALDCFEDPPPFSLFYADGFRPWFPSSGTAVSTAPVSGYTTQPPADFWYIRNRTGVNPITSRADVNTLNWANIISGTQIFPSTINVNGSSAGGTLPVCFAMLGSPGNLAPMVGNLVFSIDTVGAPAASALGTGMNLSAVLATS